MTFRTGARLLAGIQPNAAALFHENTKLWEGIEQRKPQRTVSRQELEAVEVIGADQAASPREPAGEGAVHESATAAAARSAVRDLLQRRRTPRGYGPSAIDGSKLTALLQDAYCVSGALSLPGGTLPLRTAPSAGGLYPIRLDVAAWAVDGWTPGCRRYDPLTRTLTSRCAGSQTRRQWQAACGDPPRSRNAAAVVVLSAQFRRTTAKYGDRGYRYALIEVGHIAQNLLLLADGLGLALQPQGAFYDDTVAQLIGVDGVTTCPIYLLHVGVGANQENL